MHLIRKGKPGDQVFSWLIRLLTLITLLSLAFVIYFIVHEAVPVFQETGVGEFLFGQRWMPIAFTGEPSYGIFNFIMGTLAVSCIAMLLAIVLGVGAALYLSCAASERVRNLMYPFIDLLAGIPSVVYGFIGLVILVRLFLSMGHPSGSSVLTAAILLSVMILPFLISSISDTMVKLEKRYMPASRCLGVERWYTVAHVILPLSLRSILLSMILAMGRAMGETMAVMMVMGNANLFPQLLGKGESIAALIALEMGTAAGGSTHYHALYAAGLVLMLMLLVINIGIMLLRKRLLRGGIQ